MLLTAAGCARKFLGNSFAIGASENAYAVDFHFAQTQKVLERLGAHTSEGFNAFINKPGQVAFCP